MGSFLDVDPRGKFQLFHSKKHERAFKRLPTCRYRPGKKSMSLQPTIITGKELDRYVDKGIIECSIEAETLLDELGKQYREYRKQVRKGEQRFKGKEFKDIPVPLKSTPFAHQVRAFGFASTVNAAALLMEQGTGKTLTAIAVAAQRYLNGEVKRVLVVCPKPVIPVWPRELRKHLNIPYNVDRCPKTATTALRPMDGEGVQFLIINYEKIRTRLKELIKWGADMIILDESHKIKTHNVKRSKACHKLGNTIDYRLILTGTVLGQKLTDAFSQYLFLNASVFGHSWANFRERYCVMGGFQGKEVVAYKNLEAFSEKLHSIAFRCTKDECLDLPEESYQNMYLELSPEARRIYRELDEEMFVEIGDEELEVHLAITKLIKLRQITGGMVKHEDKLLPIAKEKIGLLEDVIDAHDWNKKLIVFVAFTHELHLVEKLAKKKKVGCLSLSGATKDKDRETIEERFREDDSIGLAAIQIDTGSEGLEFTAANTAVFYSPVFSFLTNSQARARIHRYGQDSPVTYISFVIEGTVDEQIVSFLEKYGDLSKLILETMRDYDLTGETKMGKITSEKDLEKACKRIARDLKSQPALKNVTTPADKPKRRKKTMTVKKKVKKKVATKKVAKKKVVKKKAAEPVSTGSTDNRYRAPAMAEDLGVSQQVLRMHLRLNDIEKPGKSWTWPSKRAAKDVIRTMKESIKAGLPSKKKAKPAPEPKKKKATKKVAKKKASKKKEAKPAKKTKVKKKKGKK